MSNQNVIRAWRDEEYRSGLSEAEKAQLPANPAGLIELSDAELSGVSGGMLPQTYASQCSLGWQCFSVSRCTW
jgi:mersacidin/lichenicidin family type 2 lantibiotic